MLPGSNVVSVNSTFVHVSLLLSNDDDEPVVLNISNAPPHILQFLENKSDLPSSKSQLLRLVSAPKDSLSASTLIPPRLRVKSLEFENIAHLSQVLLESKPFVADDFANASNFEVELFSFIVRKKFKKKVPTELFQRGLLESFTSAVNTIACSPRPRPVRDNFRYAFVRALKAVVRNLADDNSQKPNIKFLKNRFEKHYFGDCPNIRSYTNNRPLYSFFKDDSFNPEDSSVSFLITKIRENEIFKRDILHYLDIHLLPQCRVQGIGSFGNIINSWISEIKRRFPSEVFELRNAQIVQQFRDFLEKEVIKNKRCGIPWTRNEVKAAADDLKKVLCPPKKSEGEVDIASEPSERSSI